MIKLIAYLFSRLPNRINLLKKLELNAAFFCWKLAIQAQEENRLTFYNLLIEQAESEYNHADVLCRLGGGQLKFKFSELLNKKADNWRTIAWDSSEKPYQIDGFSIKYWVGKLFFGFRKASEFDWVDKLAFMTVLEICQRDFYQELLEHIEEKKQRDTIAWILKEEGNHAAILLSTYYEINQDKDCLCKWQMRLFLVLIFVPFALIFGSFKNA
jgi:hypothetical protein